MAKREMKRMLVVVALAAIFPGAAWSASGPERGPKGPPPEAITACEGKNAGDAVEFTNRRGARVEATCQQINGRLMAVPSTFGREENSARAGERPLGRLSAFLDLSPEQQRQVREIFAAEREKTAPLREELRNLHAQVRQAVHSGEADEKALLALADREGDLRSQLLLSRARAWRQIAPLLTPEQKEKAAKGDFLFGGGRGKRACFHGGEEE